MIGREWFYYQSTLDEHPRKLTIRENVFFKPQFLMDANYIVYKYIDKWYALHKLTGEEIGEIKLPNWKNSCTSLIAWREKFICFDYDTILLWDFAK